MSWHQSLPTILIADSDEDSRYLLRSLLELKGFQVLEANDGQEAIDITVRRRPDLLLIQLKLPVVAALPPSAGLGKTKIYEESQSLPFLSIIQLRIATSHSLQAATHILRIRLNLTCSML